MSHAPRYPSSTTPLKLQPEGNRSGRTECRPVTTPLTHFAMGCEVSRNCSSARYFLRLPSRLLFFWLASLRIARTLLQAISAALADCACSASAQHPTDEDLSAGTPCLRRPGGFRVSPKQSSAKDAEHSFGPPENAHACLGRRAPRIASRGMSRSPSETWDQRRFQRWQPRQ
jgi:hypothetical protein